MQESDREEDYIRLIVRFLPSPKQPNICKFQKELFTVGCAIEKFPVGKSAKCGELAKTLSSIFYAKAKTAVR